MRKHRKPEKGIEVRHSKLCASPAGGRCNCQPSYRGSVWSAVEGKLIRGPFEPTGAAARRWRQDALVAVRRGELRSPIPTTVADAAEALVTGMRNGSILDRSGKPYKPSARRSYESALRLRVVPSLGRIRLSAVQRRDVQAVVDRMRADGLSASVVQNTLDPLRVIFRRAIRRDELTVDPTAGLELPSVQGRRDRIESREGAAALIEALPEDERALWSVAFHAGLRRGELRALRWSCVDFDAGVLRVQWAWDDQEGQIDVKTRAGRRAVPMSAHVRSALARHRLRTGRSGNDLVFGRTAELPFVPSTVRARARKAWRLAGLVPITLHEARHCAASYFIASGMNPKQISAYLGHDDVRQTWNRYGHLLPGDEVQAAAQLDAFFGVASV